MQQDLLVGRRGDQQAQPTGEIHEQHQHAQPRQQARTTLRATEFKRTAVVAAHQPAAQPAQQGGQQEQQRQRAPEFDAAERVQAGHRLEDHDRRQGVGGPVADVAVRRRDEVQVVGTIHLPVLQRAHLAPVHRGAGRIHERRAQDRAVGQGRHLGLGQRVQHAQGAVVAAAGQVPARHPRGVGLGRGRGRQVRSRRREIAVEEGVEDRRPDHLGAALVAGAVERHEDADVRVQQQVQVAVEVVRVAGVADDALAVAVFMVEAQGVAVQARRIGALLGVHQGGRGRRQDLAALVAAALQLGDHEVGHVQRRRAHRAGRRGVDDLEGLRLAVGRGLVAGGHHRRQRGRQRLPERRVPHVQRLEDVLLDVVVEILPRHPLHDVAGQAAAVVGIGHQLARREDPRRQMGLQVMLEVDRLAVGGDEVARGVLEARGVRHQVAQRDRLALERRDPEIQVVVDVAVQVQLARLHQLHHRGPGEQLGRRADAERRVLRRRHGLLLQVVMAVAPGEDHLAVLDHRDHAAGHVAALQRERHQAVEEARQVLGGERVRLHACTRGRSGGAACGCGDGDGLHRLRRRRHLRHRQAGGAGRDQ